MSEPGYSHVWSILGISILLDVYLASCLLPDRKFAGGAAAVLAMLLVLIRNTNLLVIAMLALIFAVWRYRRGMTWKKNLLYPIMGASIGMAIHVALNSYAHGRLVFSSYGQEEFIWNRPMHLSVLFAWQQGLFLYAPIFAVVLLAGFSIRPTRPAAAAFTLLMSGFALIYGYWHCWNLGGGVGHRGFVELGPMLVPLLAACIAFAPRARPLLVAACILSVWVSLSFTAGSLRGTLLWGEQSRDTYVDHLFGSHRLTPF